ncbi:MAG: hypothetical protein EOO03_09470 [Chitinophagaceae bacterium]|nr:MAG: hypothetical protein EOO03_09470 [Chitinophagaceae bacterium]
METEADLNKKAVENSTAFYRFEIPASCVFLYNHLPDLYPLLNNANINSTASKPMSIFDDLLYISTFISVV